MVTPVLSGEPRQAKRRATEAIAYIVNDSQAAGKVSVSKAMKSKRPRINKGNKVKKVSSKKHIDIEDDDDSMDGTVIEYSWPVEPLQPTRVRMPAYYSQIRVSLTSIKSKRVFNARHGGSIRLSNGNGKQLFCRVNRFVTRVSNAEHGRGNGDVKVEGNWLLNRKDLIKHFGNAVTPECQDYIDKLQRNELVLTNTSCALDIAGIEGNIRLQYIQPNQPIPTDTSINTYMCRFTLEIDTTRRTLKWGFIDPLKLDDPSADDIDEEVFEEHSHVDLDESVSSSSADFDSDTSSSVEEISKVAIHEGGSAILRTEIRVGSKFQVDIRPFNVVPFVQSRKPMLMYKADSVSDDDLLLFLNDVADIHNKYLVQSTTTMGEPYSPMSHALVEKVINETPALNRLTGSSMSTASMLAGKRCRLLKECDSDALLEILASHKYDTKCALEAIKEDLNQITSGWTQSEKDIFDDAFRRNNGSLRKISKAIAPTKSVKEVIDYFYRFKVSDQFRKFQDKKRAMAVRIVECIESKKYCESLTLSSNGGPIGTSASTEGFETLQKPSHWSEKTSSSVALARDDRIYVAKRLLLDVKDKLGSKKMAEVASAIRQLQVCYEPLGRSSLFKLLDGQPELQRRFLNFLPKHF